MGSASSIESGEAAPQYVTPQQAQEIMRVVFANPVSHAQVKALVSSTSGTFIDASTAQAILQALNRPAQQQQQAAPVQQVPVTAAQGQLSSAVRETFYGQFDSVRSAFAAADVNGGGSISHEEFGECVRKAGLNITDEQVEAAAAAIDSDHDGSINYNEFLTFLTNAQEVDEQSENIVSCCCCCCRIQFTRWIPVVGRPLCVREHVRWYGTDGACVG